MLSMALPGLKSQDDTGLSVNEAIRIALENNPEVLQANKEIEAAGGRVLQAGRIANPEVEVRWSEAPSLTKLGDAGETEISIKQDIEFPSRVGFRVDVAEDEREIARIRFERIRRIVSARTKQAYYATLFSMETLRNLQSQEDLFEDLVGLAMDQLNVGVGNYLDVLRAKVELTRVGNQILEARQSLREKRIELSLVLGVPVDREVPLTDSFPLPREIPGWDSMLDSLIEKSTFLRGVHLSAERAESALSLARTAFLPDFSAEIAFQSIMGEPPFNANNFTGTSTTALGLSLSASVPLWFWKDPEGQVEEATALVSLAEYQVRAAELRVRSSLLTAIGQLDAARDQLDTFDRSLLYDLEDILATGTTQYQNNQISALDILDIYRTYRIAKLEYARALFNYAQAEAEFEAAPEVPLFDEETRGN
jgi:outer membrane protein TolC